MNKNLKLLLINYLSQTVDALFHFPSRSQYTWDRTYGRNVCNIEGKVKVFCDRPRWPKGFWKAPDFLDISALQRR